MSALFEAMNAKIQVALADMVGEGATQLRQISVAEIGAVDDLREYLELFKDRLPGAVLSVPSADYSKAQGAGGGTITIPEVMLSYVLLVAYNDNRAEESERITFACERHDEIAARLLLAQFTRTGLAASCKPGRVELTSWRYFSTPEISAQMFTFKVQVHNWQIYAGA